MGNCKFNLFGSVSLWSLLLFPVNNLMADIISIPNSKGEVSGRIVTSNSAMDVQSRMDYEDGVLQFEMSFSGANVNGVVDAHGNMVGLQGQKENFFFNLANNSQMPLLAALLIPHGYFQTINRIASPNSGINAKVEEEAQGDDRIVTITLPSRKLGSGPYEVTPIHRLVFTEGKLVEGSQQVYSSEGLTLSGMKVFFGQHDEESGLPLSLNAEYYSLNDKDVLTKTKEVSSTFNVFKSRGVIAQADYSEERARKVSDDYSVKEDTLSPALEAETSFSFLFFIGLGGGGLALVAIAFSIFKRSRN